MRLKEEVSELIARAQGVVAEAKGTEGQESTLHNWLFGGISRGSRHHDKMGKVWELERQLNGFTARGGRMEQMFDAEIMEDPYGSWQVNDTQFMDAYFKLKELTDEVEGVVRMRKRLAGDQRQRAQERREAEAAAKAAKASAKADEAAKRAQREEALKQKREWESGLQAKKYEDRLPGRNLAGDPLPPSKSQTWGEWAGSFF